ncbi:uncharacterized protein redic1 isoform X2 [Festucalex cinctus]
MNWVGGSRKRLMTKDDTKKQREFFQKRKMQNKWENLAVSTPSSSKHSSFGSMDLLTMFVVNRIATKKELKDPPQVSVLGSKRGGKKRGVHPLVLPMSPGSPSQLSLVESQPQCRWNKGVQGGRTKKMIPQAFKIQRMSPVVECSFSDNSASDYMPSKAEHLSPFSSSSSSSGRIFQQGRHIHPLPGWFLTPWGTSGQNQNTFQPFRKPGGMPEDNFRSSNPATLSAALFGIPHAAPDHQRPEDTFLSHRFEPEFTLDFALNQTGNKQQFDDIFKGFACDEYETDACHFGSEKAKLFNKEETSIQALASQTVPDPQSAGEQISPVVECSFSDNYVPHNAEHLSPFPSLSSSSSERIFQQGRHSHPLPGWFLTPWGTSGQDQNTFQPFCKPGGMPEDNFRSSNSATPSAALFGTPHAATDHQRAEDTLLSHRSQPEFTLDFALNQAGNEQQFDNIFKGFACDEYETDACHFGSEKAKIFFKDETSIQASTPQTIPEPQSVGEQLSIHNLNSYPELPYLPTFSCKWGYASSASSDGEESCHPPAYLQKHAPANSPQICACKEEASEKRDADTQTILQSTSEKFHVAIQCSLLSESSAPVVSLQQEATRVRTGCIEAPAKGSAKTKRKQTLRRNKKGNFLGLLNPNRRSNSRMSSQVSLQDTVSKNRKGMQQSPLEQEPPDEAKSDNAPTRE